MKKKYEYQSDALGVIHQDALASFRVGAISEARMREYDLACLVAEDPHRSLPAHHTARRRPASVAALSHGK